MNRPPNQWSPLRKQLQRQNHQAVTSMQQLPRHDKLDPKLLLRSVTLPQKAGSAVSILYQLPGEYGRAANNTMTLKPAKMVPSCGKLVESRSGSRLRRLLNGLMEVHYGEFAGIGSRLLRCATGFAPAVLFGSGLLMWRRRLRSLQVRTMLVAARAALRAEALSLK